MTTDVSGLAASVTTLVRTVDALGAEELAAPSLLPGWTRGHVVAHLALNGEALAGVLEAVRRQEPVAMYESDEQRDLDIEELAGAQQADLLDRLLASTTLFADAVEAMGEDDWRGTFMRTPGGEQLPASLAVQMRWREVEVHLADLGAVYSRSDWPTDFLVALLTSEADFHQASGPITLRPTDLDGTWEIGGPGGPTVTGRASEIGWWLTGRDGAEGLSSDAGALPTLGPWRRASATAVPTPEK